MTALLIWWRATPGLVKAALAGAVLTVLVLAAFTAWLATRDARIAQETTDQIEAARNADRLATQERMNNADIGTGDPDDDAGWLLWRGQGTD